MKISNKLIRNFYIFHLLGAIIGSGAIANGIIAINYEPQSNTTIENSTQTYRYDDDTWSVYTYINYPYTYDLHSSGERISIQGLNKTTGTTLTEMMGYSQETSSKYLIKYKNDGGFGDKWTLSYFNLTSWTSTKITLTFTGYDEKFFDAKVRITLSGSDDVYDRVYTRVLDVSATKLVLYGNSNNVINYWTVDNLATKK